MKTLSIIGGTLLACAAGAMAGTTTTVQFEHIRFSPTVRALSANDMSSDGRYFVGDYDLNNNPFSDGMYLWDSVTNTVTYLPADLVEANAVSDDGTVVLGDIFDPNYGGAETAAIWSAANGVQSLGGLSGLCGSKSSSHELSDDGTVAVGLAWIGCSARGFCWTASGGMQELQSLINGNNRASVVSADGLLAAGFAGGVGADRTPSSWNTASLAGSVISPPYDGSVLGEVQGLSDDGSVLVGQQYLGAADGRVDAVEWVNGGAPEILGAGSLLGGWGGTALDIADDGTIVGFDFLLTNRRAWIQPQGQGGLVLLHQWATQHGATIPAGVNLEVAQAIARDGSVIAGHGSTGAWRLIVTRTGCPGDANGDGQIDFDDLNIVLGSYNQAGANLPGDFDSDGDVDFADLNAVLGAYNTSC